ncbi:11722_t:CDS:2, partial [Funneliformis mosseae]
MQQAKIPKVIIIGAGPGGLALYIDGKAIPDPLPDVEFHGISIINHAGNLLLRPPTKQVQNLQEIVKIPDDLSIIISYQTKEGVWVTFDDGSQEFCDILVGADEINSPVRKQRLSELQIFDYGVTHVNTNVAVPKNLMDRIIKLHGNSLLQKSLG